MENAHGLPFQFEVGAAQMKEKVLVFSSREICYNSNSFFANQMAMAFEKIGYTADVCEFTKDDDLDKVLAPYIGKKYKLILDFNSLMTRMVEEDGTPILDMIDGAFYDYILDHPLFHYNGLTAGLNNLNAILLDEAQKKYVDRFYKGVKNTVMMPLGATEALTVKKLEETPKCVLFMGTYDSPQKLYDMVEMSPEPLQSYMKKLIEMRLAEPELPMEDAFVQLLREEDEELTDEQFALFMNAMYPVDAYIRDYYRKAALDTLAKAKIPVKVVGDGWEKYESPNEAYLTREKAVVFSLSFEKIAKEHILLNNSPIFNRGAHDRIYAGMANHCAVMTDTNPYLRREMKDGENICLYSLKDMQSIVDMAEELMTNPAYCRQIQDAAYAEYLEKHSWEKRVQQLLNAIEKK